MSDFNYGRDFAKTCSEELVLIENMYCGSHGDFIFDDCIFPF
jgi:hypothetical protein